MLVGGIEGGGTTFRCAVAEHPLEILDETTIPTTTPAETLGRVTEYFRGHPELARLGFASFGPVCLDREDPAYGCVLATPKLDWQHTSVLRPTADVLRVDCTLATDVGAAVLAEHAYGAAKGSRSCVYATVGTGIGAAALVDGASPTALFHEEMGHMLVPRQPDDEGPNVCPFHESCLEGFAAAPALQARWGLPPHELPAGHPGWRIEARYLAAFCVNVTRTLAPDTILLGGGVMQHAPLLGLVRGAFAEAMAGYHTPDEAGIAKLIKAPALEPDAGLIGALHLATL